MHQIWLTLTLAIATWLGWLAALPPGRADDGGAKLEHLLHAARHLEHAGEIELAAKAYNRLAAAAQAYGRRLVLAPGEPPPHDDGGDAGPSAAGEPARRIAFEGRMVEFSWAELRQSGLSLISFRSLFEPDAARAVVDDDGQIVEFVELLCKQGLARIVARPKAATVDGRPTTLEIGRTWTSGANRPSPVFWTWTPHVLDDHRLKLTIEGCAAATPETTSHGRAPRAEPAREPAQGRAEQRTDVSAQARLNQAAFAIEVHSGDTVILPRSGDGSRPDESAILALVTVRVMGTRSSVPASPEGRATNN